MFSDHIHGNFNESELAIFSITNTAPYALENMNGATHLVRNKHAYSLSPFLWRFFDDDTAESL